MGRVYLVLKIIKIKSGSLQCLLDIANCMSSSYQYGATISYITLKARSHIETQLNSTVEFSCVSVSFNM